MAARSWSRLEAEATVADYLEMLAAELRGQEYSKTEHRRRLSPLLDARSDSAIELKHQNISAILIELGIPYVTGYKPARNYQKLLRDVVVDRIAQGEQLVRLFDVDVESPPLAPRLDDILDALVVGPEQEELRRRAEMRRKREVTRRSRQTPDYVQLEAENQDLGRAGERFVLDFERARLSRAGQSDLARRVEHVSLTQGDGLGFDIRSFENTGADRLIEVKTTKYGMYWPFVVSRNELGVSKERPREFYLYRVFEFRQSPRVFVRAGALDAICTLDPVQFKAWVA